MQTSYLNKFPHNLEQVFVESIGFIIEKIIRYSCTIVFQKTCEIINSHHR